MDFGIAKLRRSSPDATGRTVDPYNTSPGQIQGARSDPRGPYSLGVSSLRDGYWYAAFQGDSDYSIMAAHLNCSLYLHPNRSDTAASDQRHHSDGHREKIRNTGSRRLKHLGVRWKVAGQLQRRQHHCGWRVAPAVAQRREIPSPVPVAADAAAPRAGEACTWGPDR